MLMLGMVVVSSVTENVGIGECFNLTSLVCSLVDRYIGDYGYWLRRELSPDRNDDDDDDGGPSGKEKSAKIIRSLLAGWLAGCVRCQCLWLYQLVLGLLKIMIFVPYSGYYYTGCRVYERYYEWERGRGSGQAFRHLAGLFCGHHPAYYDDMRGLFSLSCTPQKTIAS